MKGTLKKAFSLALLISALPMLALDSRTMNYLEANHPYSKFMTQGYLWQRFVNYLNNGKVAQATSAVEVATPVVATPVEVIAPVAVVETVAQAPVEVVAPEATPVVQEVVTPVVAQAAVEVPTVTTPVEVAPVAPVAPVSAPAVNTVVPAQGYTEKAGHMLTSAKDAAVAAGQATLDAAKAHPYAAAAVVTGVVFVGGALVYNKYATRKPAKLQVPLHKLSAQAQQEFALLEKVANYVDGLVQSKGDLKANPFLRKTFGDAVRGYDLPLLVQYRTEDGKSLHQEFERIVKLLDKSIFENNRTQLKADYNKYFNLGVNANVIGKYQEAIALQDAKTQATLKAVNAEMAPGLKEQAPKQGRSYKTYGALALGTAAAVAGGVYAYTNYFMPKAQ